MRKTTLEQCIDWVKIKLNNHNKDLTGYEWNMLLAILQYLERLEGLELGCPLDVVFKALKQSEIYSIDECFEDLSLAVDCGGWYLWNNYGCFLYLKDYKKTWFLKEDLSE